VPDFMLNIPKVILFLESSRQYGRDLINGIAEYSLINGPWTFYKEDDFYSTLKKGSGDLSWIKRWGANGIITRDFKGFDRLLEFKLPIIVVEAFQETNKVGNVPKVVSNHDAIGGLACDYFIRHGFKNFAYCGFTDMPWSVSRGERFASALKSKGYQPEFFYSKSYRLLVWDKEYPRLVRWLTSLPRPAAILCCNDDRGCDVIEACKTAGLRVPFDIAVLGIDDDPQVCNLTYPPLSSIMLSTKKAGFLTAQMLHELMRKEQVAENTIKVEPVGIDTRQSTDSLAIEDPQVAKAMEFISANSNPLIQVTDVLYHVGCSRRGLDEKFHKILGHSIFAEIRRIRIEMICNMLLKTNRSISEIALALGYNDADHIARFFKQEKHMTPFEYRKTYASS